MFESWQKLVSLRKILFCFQENPNYIQFSCLGADIVSNELVFSCTGLHLWLLLCNFWTLCTVLLRGPLLTSH